MVDSQPCSSSDRARTLDTSDEEEEKAEAPKSVPTCWGHPGAYSYPEANICTPKKSPPRSLASRLQWRKWSPSNISIASLNFASLSSPSSLANSYTFLISVWRLVMDLAQLAPATVLGRKRRVLFLAWLKDRKIFGLCFLCLSCDAYKSSGILGSWKWENLESPQDSGVCRRKRMILPGRLI